MKAEQAGHGCKGEGKERQIMEGAKEGTRAESQAEDRLKQLLMDSRQ